MFEAPIRRKVSLPGSPFPGRNESVPIRLAQCWFPGLDWPFPMLKYEYIFQIKYKQFYQTAPGKLIAVKRNNFIVLLIIIFGTRLFRIGRIQIVVYQKADEASDQ